LELLKLKRSGDERRGMKRKVVKQIKRMRMRGRMGKKWKELRGGHYHKSPPFHLHPL